MPTQIFNDLYMPPSLKQVEVLVIHDIPTGKYVRDRITKHQGREGEMDTQVPQKTTNATDLKPQQVLGISLTSQKFQVENKAFA